jgi:cobalamin-dependent methionine synthase I
MQTRLKGVKKEAVIDTEGTTVIIGEKINPTGRKKLATALQAGRLD